MTDGIKDKHRAAIVAAIAANERVERAVLFGSRAMGTNTVTSDVDIVLFGDRLTLTDQARLAAALDEIPMAQSVDLILYDSIQDRMLREHIRNDGVEWFVRENASSRARSWPMVRLGNHADACLGKMLDQKKNRGELFPYLGNKNVRWGSFDTSDLGQMRFEDHEHDRYGLKYGDLVVCEGGEPGRCAIWKDEVPGMKIQKALHRIRAREQLDNRFLHYWFLLAGRNGALEPYFTGTTIKHLTGKAIAELQIPLAPKPEQRAIAHILGTLDDKIELNLRMNVTLEAMARALFQSWFVDFDPVRAKMEDRDPYLASEYWDLFPDGLDNECKPRGWRCYGLGDLVHHHRSTVTPSAEPKRIFEHYSIPAHDAGGEPSLDPGRSIKSNKTIVPDGAVLLSKLNPDIERVWLPNLQGETPQIASTEFLAFTPLRPATRSILFCLFKSGGFREKMVAMVTGTSKSHQRVPPEALLAQEVLVGEPRLFQAFNRMVRPVIALTLAKRSEVRTLAQTRNLLLPKLISGEIRVQAAERLVEVVA